MPASRMIHQQLGPHACAGPACYALKQPNFFQSCVTQKKKDGAALRTTIPLMSGLLNSVAFLYG